MKKAQQIINAYGDKFANADEILHLAHYQNPAFLRLLSQAVRSGKPLTRARIASVLGEAPWEEIDFRKARHSSGSASVLITGADGKARRSDGKSLTRQDRAILRGADPLAACSMAARQRKKT